MRGSYFATVWITNGIDLASTNITLTMLGDPFLKLRVAPPQDTVATGVQGNNVDDVSGPEATQWFASDIAAHIEFRHREVRQLFRPGGLPLVELDSAVIGKLYTTFQYQAKYLMAPKWIYFGSPMNGKGVNTVIVGDKVVRKNVLGNIEFAIIAELGLGHPKADVKYAYGEEYGGRYPKTHPYSTNYGPYADVYRADNLAAFGVGHGIARDLQEKAKKYLDIMTMRDLTPAERDEFVNIVKEVLVKNMSDGDLNRRVNKYHDLLENATHKN